jgi:hypothetical protein
MLLSSTSLSRRTFVARRRLLPACALSSPTHAPQWLIVRRCAMPSARPREPLHAVRVRTLALLVVHHLRASCPLAVLAHVLLLLDRRAMSSSARHPPPARVLLPHAVMPYCRSSAPTEHGRKKKKVG